MTNDDITLQIAELEKLYDKAKGTPCLVFSRIVGYFSAVNKDWNAGKLAEWADRVPFNVNGGKHV